MKTEVIQSVIEFVKTSSETIDSLLSDLEKATAGNQAAQSKVAAVVNLLLDRKLIASNERDEAVKMASTLEGSLDMLSRVLLHYSTEKKASTELGRGVESPDAAPTNFVHTAERAPFGSRESDNVLRRFAERVNNR